tara:strand:- start:3026 stop:3136 length:111 start_codon:yes stop_codon:yes gene_type:complete
MPYYLGDIREDKGFIVVLPVEMNIPKGKNLCRWWNL